MRREGRRRTRDGRGTLPHGLRIEYEDAELLVVDKPAGLLSAAPPAPASARRPPSVFGLLQQHLREGARARRGARGGRGLWIVHRLDRVASGLLVFAKSERAFNWLKQDLRARRLERGYLAVVEGELGREGAAAARGELESFLRETRSGEVVSIPVERFRGSTPGPRRARSPDEARLARTRYALVAAGRGRSLIELQLDTGRKHQIRVQLRDLGHPVVGDDRYGRGERGARLMLHAAELTLQHPASGKSLHFESPPPAEFFELVGAQPGARPKQEGVPARREKLAADPAAPAKALDTSWEHVAGWYDELIDERPSDHYRNVILPGVMRLLEPQRGQRLLDVACGQGVLCRELAAAGVEVVGVDASARLIELARERSGRGAQPRYEVGDARALEALELGRFDAAACVMALANMEPLEPVLRGCATLLRRDGVFVAVIPHPAFRAPRQSSWGFERSASGEVHQYRRVDGYLSPGQVRIVCNPGGVAAGRRPIETWSFHRPIETYVRACAESGLLVDRLEEWPSQRRSTGPRAAEENRARREIPLFLALRARRV